MIEKAFLSEFVGNFVCLPVEVEVSDTGGFIGDFLVTADGRPWMDPIEGIRIIMESGCWNELKSIEEE